MLTIFLAQFIDYTFIKKKNNENLALLEYFCHTPHRISSQGLILPAVKKLQNQQL